MTDKNSGHNSKDSKSRKPSAIRPIETAHKGSVTSDIFASSEATHLIDQGERTAMVATLDGNHTAANVSQQSDEKKVFNSGSLETKLYPPSVSRSTKDSSLDTVDGAEAKTSILDQEALLKDAVQTEIASQRTQLLDALDAGEESEWLGDHEHTKALVTNFDEPDEQTAFFNTNRESAQPRQDKSRLEKRQPAPFVDPRPRRSVNEENGVLGAIDEEPAPRPTPRASGSKRSKPQQRTSKSRTGARHRNQRSASVNPPEQDRRQSEVEEVPLDVGVFAPDASRVLEDVIDEVVKASWDEVPNQVDAAPPSGVQPRFSKTLRTWVMVGVGFILLIVLGLSLRTSKDPELAEDTKQRTTVAFADEAKRLGLRLPVSEFSRRIRPGTDVFLIGRRDVFIRINGADRSKSVHADSLWTTLKQRRNITNISNQLSGLQPWPLEIDIGVDASTPIAEVERLNSALARQGVERTNLLTESNQAGGFGELALDVRSKIDSIPSIGALNMEVKGGTILVSLVKPQSKPKPLATLETFEARLEDKLDKVIESFAFENPRVVRAIVRVPTGLRLTQVVELCKPLILDERMRRVTIVPYPSQKSEQTQP